MRFLAVFIGLLAVSSILAQKAPASAAPVAKVENLKLKSDIARMEKLRAELKEITDKGGDYDLTFNLKRKAPAPKALLKPTKVEKKIVKVEKKVKKDIQKAKVQIAIAKKTNDKKKQEKAQQKLNKLYRKQEFYRVKQEKIIQKKVKKLEKKEKKAQIKVNACVNGQIKKGCKKIMKKHFQRKQVIAKLRDNRQKVLVKITVARENHVKAFKGVKSVEAKKAVVIQRFNIKTKAIENKITKEEKKIVRLEQRRQTPRIQKKIEKEKKKLAVLKIQAVKLEKQKIRVIRLKTTGCKCGCAARLRKILNVIHINLVSRGPNGEKKVTRQILRFSSNPGQKTVKLLKVKGGVVRLRINSRKVDNKTFKLHASRRRSTKALKLRFGPRGSLRYRRNKRRIVRGGKGKAPRRRYRRSVSRRYRRYRNRRSVSRRNRKVARRNRKSVARRNRRNRKSVSRRNRRYRRNRKNVSRKDRRSRRYRRKVARRNRRIARRNRKIARRNRRQAERKRQAAVKAQAVRRGSN
jgi:hypothetical protein